MNVFFTVLSIGASGRILEGKVGGLKYDTENEMGLLVFTVRETR